MKKFSFETKKVIVFDLDGTIVHLKIDWKFLKSKLTKKYNTIYDDKCNFTSISSCLSKVVERNDKKVLESFFNVIRKYELENIEETVPIEESIFFINNRHLFRIYKDIKLTILSLNTRNTIIKSLKLAKIFKKIDFIVGREDVRHWKPDPEGLIKIKSHYKLKNEEMIYFGDLENDLKTGQNANIETYYIDELINLVNRKKSELKQY
ncbi:MAG: HAD-IA family hydrolase [Promethearchaeota archaeon]